jgi:hypothetical protein
MQDPKTHPTSFDAPMGHTLTPVDATLPRSTATQLQTPWVRHPHDGKPMQLLHSLGNGPLKNYLGAHSAERPQLPARAGGAWCNAAMSSCTSWPTARLNQAGADWSIATA